MIGRSGAHFHRERRASRRFKFIRVQLDSHPERSSCGKNTPGFVRIESSGLDEHVAEFRQLSQVNRFEVLDHLIDKRAAVVMKFRR